MAYCSLDFLQNKLASLPLKKYNKYQWWRRFEYRNELSDKAPLRDRISHGDFEPSDYLYQAEFEDYLLSEKESKAKTADEAHELRKLFQERKRRLIEDYEKDEKQIVQKFLSALKKEFGVSLEYLTELMAEFDGTNLELYDELHQRKLQKITSALKS